MILITGASRGIGKFLLEKFLHEKLEVYGTYNSSVPDPSISKYYSEVDIMNRNLVDEWIKEKTKSIDKLVLINCAGTNYNAMAHKSDLELWEEVIDVNLKGTFRVIRTVLPIMRQIGYGRIINFSSIVGQTGIPGTSAYAASKSGLWGMTKSIMAENANKNITINNLNLGYFQIGMIDEVPENFQEIIKSKIPAGDFGDPENIFRTVKYIIENDYINGTSLDINGGLY